MAEKAYAESGRGGFRTVTWTGVTSADTFAPYEVGGAAITSVQFAGTFDSATVLFQGSNDGTTYGTLNDLQVTALSKTAAAIEGVAESVRWVKPVASGGGGSQSLTLIMLVGKWEIR